MPAGAGGKGVEGCNALMIGQQAEGVSTKGMADHVQRQAVVRHGGHGGTQILVGPIQIVHAETAQALWFGQPDAAVVQRLRGVAAFRCMLGKGAIEALWHTGGTRDHDAADGVMGAVAQGGDAGAVAGVQGQRLGFALNAHGLDLSWGRIIETSASQVSAMALTLPATRACSSAPS